MTLATPPSGFYGFYNSYKDYFIEEAVKRYEKNLHLLEGFTRQDIKPEMQDSWVAKFREDQVRNYCVLATYHYDHVIRVTAVGTAGIKDGLSDLGRERFNLSIDAWAREAAAKDVEKINSGQCLNRLMTYLQPFFSFQISDYTPNVQSIIALMHSTRHYC